MFDLDQSLAFAIPHRHVRGRVVRLGPLLDEILKAHDYPPPIERLLVEALTVTALLGAMLKEAGGQLTMQAQTEKGVVSLLVCDYRDGDLRGYVKYDSALLSMYGKNPSLKTLMGKAYLAITFDQSVSDERYQGIVPLDAASLAEAVEHYFVQSEQIPSMVRVGVTHEEGVGAIGGGLLLQHLPLETLVWRLFNEDEIRSLGVVPLKKGCRCDMDHIRSVLARFPEDERAQMADDDGVISVDCAFCAKAFPVAFDS